MNTFFCTAVYLLNETLIDIESTSTKMIRFFFWSNNSNSIWTYTNAAFPEILASDLKDQSVYESCPVSFEIIAQGIPKLEAQWTLNDKPLKADDHFDITEDGLKYKLSIADVKLTDAGQFKVVVKNKLGELSKECKLNVMRKYTKSMFEWNIVTWEERMQWWK